MATITPIAVGLSGAADAAPVTPSASDVIPCAAYKYVLLKIVSSTGTPTVTVDDPTTPAIPAAKTAADPDLQIGPLSAGQTYTRLLPTSRYRDSSGNINIATASPANSTIICYGIPV